MRVVNTRSLTQFHLVIDAQDSPKIFQKAFFIVEHRLVAVITLSSDSFWDKTILKKQGGQADEVRKALLTWHDSYVFFPPLSFLFLKHGHLATGRGQAFTYKIKYLCTCNPAQAITISGDRDEPWQWQTRPKVDLEETDPRTNRHAPTKYGWHANMTSSHHLIP